jgi:hypothetical protein
MVIITGSTKHVIESLSKLANAQELKEELSTGPNGWKLRIVAMSNQLLKMI